MAVAAAAPVLVVKSGQAISCVVRSNSGISSYDNNKSQLRRMSEAGTSADAVAAEKERKFRIQGRWFSKHIQTHAYISASN